MDDNTVMECIRTIAVTYGCKIYNCSNTMQMSMDMEQNDTTRIPVPATQKTEDY